MLLFFIKYQQVNELAKVEFFNMSNVLVRCLRVSPNVVAACRRRGYRKGLDESQKLLFRTAARTSCTPACGKLLVELNLW